MKYYLERPAIDPDSDPQIWWLSEKQYLLSLHKSICVHVEQVYHQNTFSARPGSSSIATEADSHHKMLICWCFWLKICRNSAKITFM